MTGFDNQGLALGEVYGFRWWNWNPGGKLRGQFGDWQPGVNRAECQYAGRHDEPAPYEECGCGMWAYWTPSAAPIPNGRRVAGVVKGWGDTLIGDQGCRCQLAAIMALSFEKIATTAVQYEDMVHAAGPPPGVHWRHPEGAMSTYLAFGGTPVDVPVRRMVTERYDDLAKQAHDEYQLGQAYGVPVYTTTAAMLAHFPLTADYLPPPPTVEDLNKALDNLKDFGAKFSKAIDDLLMPHILSGADALERLNKRLKDAP